MKQKQVVPLDAPRSPQLSSPSFDSAEPDPAFRIFAILPVAVQARIPRFTSLRRSMSSYSLSSSTPSLAPPSHMPTTSADLCRARNIVEHKRPSAPTWSSPASRDGEPERDTGTGWKYANQGNHTPPINRTSTLKKPQD